MRTALASTLIFLCLPKPDLHNFTATCKNIDYLLRTSEEAEQAIDWYNISHISAIEAVFQRCSVKKAALRKFAKFTEKHLFQRLFLIKLQAFPAFGLNTERCYFKCWKGLQLY